MTNTPTDHLESVHLLRGIAALMVLMAHAFRSFYFWDVSWFDKSVLDVGQIGVSVFFVISGFVLPLSLQKSYRLPDFPRFLLRRFVRIEPTYLASMVVAIAWVWTATRLAPNATPWRLDIGQVLAHLMYLVPFTDYKWINDVYWTLAIEFQFYLFIGAAFVLFRGAANKSVFLPGALIVVFACVAFLYRLCIPIQLLRFAPFFGIGLLAWWVFCYPVSQRLYVLTLVAIMVIGAFSGLSFSNLIFGAAAFFVILLWKPGKSRWRFLGTISYSLYVIHPPIVAIEHVIGLRLAGTMFKPALFLLPLAAIAASIGAAWVLHRLVEGPTMRLSRRIRYV
jgi:peptidoglycan/LPS O-acetylase OafA/YrhL